MSDADNGSNGIVTVDPARELAKQLGSVLRPEKQNEAVRVIQTVMRKLHIGPLPAPEDFQQYEDTCPGSSGRILTMAEKNQDHRHAMERDHLRFEYRLQARGQHLAITALIFMLAVIAFALWVGQPIAAGVLGGATILGVVSMFLGRDKPTPEPEPAKQVAKKRPGKRR